MKVKLNPDKEMVQEVREALVKNNFYCPCIINSKERADPREKCMCENFLHNTPAGQYCLCGLYYKEEE